MTFLESHSFLGKIWLLFVARPLHNDTSLKTIQEKREVSCSFSDSQPGNFVAVRVSRFWPIWASVLFFYIFHSVFVVVVDYASLRLSRSILCVFFSSSTYFILVTFLPCRWLRQETLRFLRYLRDGRNGPSRLRMSKSMFKGTFCTESSKEK